MIFFKYIFITITLAVFSFLCAAPIGILLGKIRAKHKILQEDLNVRLTNPYQYYKELPNNYGIGIATLLNDSTIENEKDIIAALLDLCAKGYLHLSKHSDHYVIRLLPTAKPTTLTNEAYLLDLIRSGNLTQIDYHRWYQLCANDGIALNLFYPTKLPSLFANIHTTSEKLHKITKSQESKFPSKFWLFFTGFFIVTVILAIQINSEILNNILATVFLSALVLGFVIALIKILTITLIFFRSASQNNYDSTLKKRLRRTPKGDAELQKLLSFKAFLAQFSTFVDKNPEAVIIWDRYLSYAQVFGLADQLQKSGYQELITNAAFKIDNIDQISLQNLSISS